jgi:hypothetical protein
MIAAGPAMEPVHVPMPSVLLRRGANAPPGVARRFFHRSIFQQYLFFAVIPAIMVPWTENFISLYLFPL